MRMTGRIHASERAVLRPFIFVECLPLIRGLIGMYRLVNGIQGLRRGVMPFVKTAWIDQEYKGKDKDADNVVLKGASTVGPYQNVL